MSVDPFARVLFNDGEGLDPTDLNDVGKLIEARLFDQVLQYLVPSTRRTIDVANLVADLEYGGQNGLDVETRYAYCLTPGAAFLRQGSASNKVRIAAGTLLQKTGTTDGTQASLLSYTFDGTSTYEFTLTAGSAANPRVDLLQMKLERVSDTSVARDFKDATTGALSTTTPLKRNRVQCTLSVKAGTPAVSPTVPEPDAGYVAVGSVVVGTNYVTATSPVFGEDTAGASAVVHDQRMPLVCRAYRVDPSQFKLVTAWASSNNGSTVTSSNATNDLYVVCPAPIGRLLGVSVHATVPFVGTQCRLGQSNGIVTTTFASRNLAAFGAIPPEVLLTHNAFETTHQPSAGPTVQVSPTTSIGVPLWTNGRRTPHERQRLASTVSSAPLDTLVLRIQSGVNAHVLGAVTFYVATGI